MLELIRIFVILLRGFRRPKAQWPGETEEGEQEELFW